jgi:hypothetical protein
VTIVGGSGSGKTFLAAKPGRSAFPWTTFAWIVRTFRCVAAQASILTTPAPLIGPLSNLPSTPCLAVA